MNVKNAMAAAGMLALLGATAACGSNSSSTATDAGGATGAPTAATTDNFCQTLIGLGAETTPSEGAQKLEAVGTPSNTSTSERHGFEVFVDHVSKLSDKATSADFTKMEKDLSTADQADVQAFVAYVGKECADAVASQSSPAPSPSN